MKTFTTVVRYDDVSKDLDIYIKEELLKNGFTVDEVSPSIVIVIGGDGTFLHAVHERIEELDKVKFYGIHTGTLGFFTDYRSDQVDEFINDLINKKPFITDYQLLEATVDDNKKYYAVNEIRIENISRTQVIDVFVNETEFETFRGTGMCVSTQLGSTAYNRSLHGSVIQEGLPLIQLSEIAGIHHKAYRSLGASIVMKENTKIEFKSDNFSGAYLCADAYNYPIDNVNKIDVILCEKRVKMLKFKEISYFKRLQSLF